MRRLTGVNHSEPNDGLSIAEADLSTRGPGQLLGTSQHGALGLRIAELPRDIDILHDAHITARRRIQLGEPLPNQLAGFLAEGSNNGMLSGG